MSISKIVDWDKYTHLFEQREISAKTTLLEEGEISKTIFFVKKGCLRCWFNNDGKDVTFQFFFENALVSSIESFRMNEPSLFTIESIEPTVVLCISKKDFEFILAQSEEANRELEKHILERLVRYQKLFLSRIKDNPQKRYEELLLQQPEILQRVPQHYIASYLGITSVSLSRIRNRR
ncbi:Crp/Fnr family transcriptional regulator [Pedobacter sp. MW01-1-1]|uniref:Crp/Fnr family transcriptional regulator n=1 Tax=Pedobacter sp. MW01-1-1 TaxID=3383027 RepID=UPI003FEDE706